MARTRVEVAVEFLCGAGSPAVTQLYAARGWRTDLPRVVLLLQAGNAFSWFGYGLILPFEIVYLHQFRGFSTATAGLVLAAILGAGTLVTLPSGALLDCFRAKPILCGPRHGLQAILDLV